MFKISMAGSTRSPVEVIGPLAFKFAKNEKGRACNLYEADLEARQTRHALSGSLGVPLWSATYSGRGRFYYPGGRDDVH